MKNAIILILLVIIVGLVLLVEELGTEADGYRLGCLIGSLGQGDCPE